MPLLAGALAVAGALGLFLAGCSFEPVGAGVAPDGANPPPPPPPPNADPLLGCSENCHGDAYSTAPPRDLGMGVETSRRGVGAHRQHLNPTPTFHRVVACEDCHPVPGAVADPGHLDNVPGIDLTFTSIASADDVQASFDGETCTVYCHGASLMGGALTTPTWTVVDGSQDRCGNCHGMPPPEPPHLPGADCGTCHPTIQPGTRNFLDPDSHINGTIEVTADVQACDACHGGGGVSAPPRDLAGNQDRALRGVGAHRQHIGPSDWHRELSCVQCHTVPVSVDSPGHMDGDDVAEVRFDALNPAAQYSAGTATCTGLYCHGNGSRELGTMPWTQDLTLDCDSCHDDGRGDDGGGRERLSGEHRKHAEEGIECFECHADVVNRDLGFVEPNLHINGVFDVRIPSGGEFDGRQGCSNLDCHEDEEW